MQMRIKAIHMGLEAFHRMDQLWSCSVNVQMRSVEGEMQWEY